MGKKKIMKLPFLSQLSKSLDDQKELSSSPPWPFPSCGNTKTLSFRANKDETFTTFNSAFLEPQVVTPPDSFFTISSSSRSFSTFSEDSRDQVESVIRGLRSDRLFFEPERSSSLLLREEEQEQEVGITTSDGDEQEVVAYKESELLSMDSNNPYEDFKKSMEEMVQAHGLKDWQGLEELLGCYLKINGKNNHGYIVGAFIDLLVSLSFASFDASTSSTSTTTITNSTTSTSYSNYSSPSSPLSLPSSSITTPCLSSSILDHDDGDGDGDGIIHDDGYDEHDDDDHVSS